MSKSTSVGSARHSSHCIWGACLALLAAACAAAPEPQDFESDARVSDRVVPTQETVLAEVDVGYGTIRFSELTARDGSRSAEISELAPANAQLTPLDELFAKYGMLTALETFLAVLPDQEPPALLVDSQAGEASGLGRPSAAIVNAAFDTSWAIEKSLASCEGFVYLDPGTSGDWTDKRTSSFVGTSGSKWLTHSAFFTDKNVTLGLCNGGASSMTADHCWSFSASGFEDFHCSAESTVNGNTMIRWWNIFLTTPCPAPPGQFCGSRATARHLVEGFADTPRQFYLATAYLGAQLCSSSAHCATGQSCVNGSCNFIIH